MTYSVYNIKIDNNLAFNPGPTAGYVLGINADGSTSWIQAAGGTGAGSQTLEQTLALGNNVGTYSIIGQGTPGIGVLKMPSSLSSHLATKLYQSKEPFNDFSFVMLSPGVTFSGIEINSDTLNIISSNSTTMSGIYMSSDNIRLRGLSGTGSNILSIDSLGNIGITSSVSAGSQTLEQTLALGNNAGTYSVLFADGTPTSPSIAFANDADTGFYRITTATQGRIGLLSDGNILFTAYSNENDIFQTRSFLTASNNVFYHHAFANLTGGGRWKFGLKDASVQTLVLDRWIDNTFVDTFLEVNTQSATFNYNITFAAGLNAGSNKVTNVATASNSLDAVNYSQLLSFVPKRLTNQSISTTGWFATGSYVGYTFSNANIATSSNVDFTPYNDSSTIAINAMVKPYILSGPGYAIFYASYIPSGTMSGDVLITPTI